jgi:hypothetical protein
MDASSKSLGFCLYFTLFVIYFYFYFVASVFVFASIVIFFNMIWFLIFRSDFFVSSPLFMSQFYNLSDI